MLNVDEEKQFHDFLGLDDKETKMFETNTANEFFEYVYNSDMFKNILDKLSCDLKLTEDEWNYILSRLISVSEKSIAEYRKDKLDCKERIVYIVCKIGMFLFEEDSPLYNEFYKMFEYMGSIIKFGNISNDLEAYYILVDDEKDEELLKIYIKQHIEACGFRSYWYSFMNMYSKNVDKESIDISEGRIVDNLGYVNGEERYNINMMNRAYDSTKKLVKKYDEWYNMNIDCEEE